MHFIKSSVKVHVQQPFNLSVLGTALHVWKVPEKFCQLVACMKFVLVPNYGFPPECQNGKFLKITLHNYGLKIFCSKLLLQYCGRVTLWIHSIMLLSVQLHTFQGLCVCCVGYRTYNGVQPFIKANLANIAHIFLLTFLK